MTATIEIEYRTIRDFPDYVITAAKAVWSIPRQRPGKGGSVRTLPARQLTPDDKSRVWLCRDDTRERHHVEDLFRRHFTEIAYPKRQAECRKGHPLAQSHVWGSGNRVCAQCFPGWTPPPRPARVTADVDHWAAPQRLHQGDRPIGIRHVRENVGRTPVPVDDDEDDDTGGLLAAGHGFIPETFSRTSGHVSFPPICLVPDRLRGLDVLMRQRP